MPIGFKAVISDLEDERTIIFGKDFGDLVSHLKKIDSNKKYYIEVNPIEFEEINSEFKFKVFREFYFSAVTEVNNFIKLLIREKETNPSSPLFSTEYLKIF